MTSGLDYDVDQMSEMFLKLSYQTIYKWNCCELTLKQVIQIIQNVCGHIVTVPYNVLFTTLNPDLWLDNASIYTITLVMLVIAIKFWDDHKHSNKYFAKLGGISLRLLNEMELELLQLMDFNLFVKEDELYRYMKFFT